MKLAILGATGRTGVAVTRLALEAGHSVRVLVRTPAKLTLAHERLQVIQGDATNAGAVAELVSGCDAVISAVGPTSGHQSICSEVTRNVLAARPNRYVVVSGAGLDAPGDEKNLPDRIVARLIRFAAPAVFADKKAELELLLASEVAFVAARPPRLVDKPAKGQPRVSLKRPQSTSIPREDLAAFLVLSATDDTYLRRAPFVSGR